MENIRSLDSLRVYQTDNQTFLIMFHSPNGGFEEGDIMYSYFEHEGKFYVNGKSNRIPKDKNSTLVSFMSESNLPDGTPFINGISGAPPHAEIGIACVRDGIAFKVNPGVIHIYTGNELPRNVITSLPLTLFHLRGVSVNLEEEVELHEIPYFQWYSEQCPSWPKTEYSATHMCHKMHEGDITKGDGSIWRTIRRVPVRRITPIELAKPSGSAGTYFELIEGTGRLGTNHYDLSDDDIENRTQIIIRQYANRRENCGMKSNPFVDFAFNLEKLPYVPNQMFKLMDALPPGIPTIALEATPIIDQLLYEDTHIIVGLRAYGENNKNGYRLVVGNKVNDFLYFSLLHENGSVIFGNNMRAGQVRYFTAYNLSLDKYDDYDKLYYKLNKYNLEKTIDLFPEPIEEPTTTPEPTTTTTTPEPTTTTTTPEPIEPGYKTVNVDYDFDSLLVEDNYFAIGIKNNFIAVVNKLNIPVSCFINEAGKTATKSGFGMTGGTFKISSVSVINVRNKGKVHEITLTSTKEKIKKTFTVTL